MQWGADWGLRIEKTENWGMRDGATPYHHHHHHHQGGGVKGLEGHSEAILKLVHQKINFFIYWHIIYHWKGKSMCFKNLLLFFGLEGHFSPWSSYLKMDLKSEFFDFFQPICFWKAETKLVMNLLEFLRSEVIWDRERSSKVIKGQTWKITEPIHVICFWKPLEVSMLDSYWL